MPRCQERTYLCNLRLRDRGSSQSFQLHLCPLLLDALLQLGIFLFRGTSRADLLELNLSLNSDLLVLSFWSAMAFSTFLSVSRTAVFALIFAISCLV